MNDKTHWAAIIEQVKNPLGFFSLSLLVIEAVFGAVVVFSKMGQDYQYRAFLIMTGLFIAIVLIVTLLSIIFPKHLWEQLNRTSAETERLASILESTAFSDKIDERISQHPSVAKNTDESGA
jgi:heme A synthase